MVLRRIILLLSSWAGVFVTIILSYSHSTKTLVPCGSNTGGCEKVAHDAWAHILGIPVAVLGLGAHLVIGVAAVAILISPNLTRKWFFMSATMIAALSTVVSTVFTIHSKFAVHAFCNWCLASGAFFVLSTIACLALFLSESAPAPAPGRGKWAPIAPAMAIFFALLTTSGAFSEDTKSAFPEFRHNHRTTAQKIVAANQLSLIDQNRHTEGPIDAKLTVVMFGDFDCPANHASFHTVRDKTQTAGARFVFVHHTLARHEDAPKFAKMAEMATTPERFWNTAEYLMSQDDGVDADSVQPYVGLPAGTIRKRLADPSDPATQAYEKDLEVAEKLGLTDTPNFLLIEKGKDAKMMSYEDLLQRLESEPRHAKM